jgi:hypothetical protein
LRERHNLVVDEVRGVWQDWEVEMVVVKDKLRVSEGGL